MMRRLSLAALCAFAAFAAAPAQACMGPIWHHFMDQPPGDFPAGVSGIWVDFTNENLERRQEEGSMPVQLGAYRALVGSARLVDDPSGNSFPVYAINSSCMPDFFEAPRPLTLRTIWPDASSS